MADLIIRPCSSVFGKSWVLQLRYHDSLAPTEYRDIAYLDDEAARDIAGAGEATWLFGDPDELKGEKVLIDRNTTVVNVNRNTINGNTRHGTDFPVFRIQRGKGGKPKTAKSVAVLDKAGDEVARFIYRNDGALLTCGARAVLIAHHGAKPVEEI